MKISKYIGELLFEYECIVIPGLGGFITNDIPAKIQNDQRTFIPPSKKIVFNAFLKTNDGLLINQIAKAENISYFESKQKVESFVEKCFIALNDGKKINFQKVGILFFDDEKNIQFEADISQNYLGESYGMTSFISPPIRRETNRHLIEKRFIDRKQKPQTQPKEKQQVKQDYKPLTSPQVKRPRYISVNVFTLLIIAGIIFLGVKNPARIQNLYNNYSNFVPFFFQTPNEFVVKNIDNIPFEKILPNSSIQKDNSSKAILADNNNSSIETEKSDSIDTQTTLLENEELSTTEEEPSTTEKESSISKEKPAIFISEEPEVKVPEKTPEVVNIPISKKYFIIAGSFNEIENANSLINILFSKGYDSEIIGQNKFGMYRVCYSGFNSLAEARKQLAVIKRDEDEAAWIFSK